MNQKFHQRFNISVDVDEARRRFVNRVYNAIFLQALDKIAGLYGLATRLQIECDACMILGIKYKTGNPLSTHIKEDFYEYLRAIEALYRQPLVKGIWLDDIVKYILNESEIDLGVRWENGHFLSAGAPLLDEKLVNDVLGGLQDKSYDGVLKPFSKGLDHFLRSTGKPALLGDVIINMYEALEAMAKIVTGRDRDLSSNAELFISTLKLSEEYKLILKNYIEYANVLARHAGEKGQGKPLPSSKEVESFVYMTGLFLRLAMR